VYEIILAGKARVTWISQVINNYIVLAGFQTVSHQPGNQRRLRLLTVWSDAVFFKPDRKKQDFDFRVYTGYPEVSCSLGKHQDETGQFCVIEVTCFFRRLQHW